MRGVIIKMGYLLFTLTEVLGVIKVTVISRDAVIAAEIFCLCNFLARDQRLIQFLAVARTNDAYWIILGENLFRVYADNKEKLEFAKEIVKKYDKL